VKRYPSLAAALVTILAVSVTLALANDPPDSATEMRPSAVDSVAPGLSDLIQAFRRERTVRDVLSTNSAQSLELSGDATVGENPALSRRLELGEGRSAHVWPNKDGVCFGFSGSGGCTSVAHLDRERIVVLTRVGYSEPLDATLDRQVFVLATDTVESVTMAFSDGHTVSRPVTNNGALMNVSTLPEAVRWSEIDGTTGTVDVFTGRQ
jgi:hypothetical protein